MYNSMAKTKQKRQKMICKILQKKLKIDQREPTKSWWTQFHSEYQGVKIPRGWFWLENKINEK